MTTTNTQHTPGPWELSRSSTGHFIKSEEIDICHIEGVSPRATANAQLIASAPDLLKENEQLKELNRVHYEVTADQNLKIQDLKALNAELLEALKGMIANFWNEYDEPHRSDFMRDYPTHPITKAWQAITKAEGKDFLVS